MSFAEPAEPITLTFHVIGESGYGDLIAEFMKAHPKITVEVAEHRDLATYVKQVAAGKVTGDVMTLEVASIAKERTRSSQWTDLKPFLGDQADAFMPWAMRLGATKDGKKQFGVPNDTGGMAVCYRRDLMRKAGLPEDRDELAAKWSTWDDFIAVGKRYRAKTGKGMLDTATVAFRAIALQQGTPLFHDAKDRPIVATSRAAKKAWDTSIKLIQGGVTARLPMWSAEWSKGFAKGSFAALLCPRWMLGVVEGNAGGKGEWDVAKVPGGAGTWGGSWLGVPAKSKHREQAVGLAMFLTTAQNDADASYANSMVPARADAVNALAGRTEADFNDAPAAQLMGEAAGQLTWADFGPHYVDLDRAFEGWLNSVQTGDNSPSSAWSGVLAAAREFT